MLNRRPSRARGVRQVSGENVGSKDGKSMTMLQDLVPGCNWITGKTVMLDEIINYVQSLQRQVDFLSMLVLLYPQSEVVLLGSSQEIFCVLLVDVSTSSEDRNLRLLCSHAINDIQDASVGLGLQVITLVFYGSAFKLDSVPMFLISLLLSGGGYNLRRSQSTIS
ncbi:hypothetical protein Bca4012_042629 [Brassica carinata]